MSDSIEDSKSGIASREIEGEISLLDILIVISDNVRLLALGSLVVGVVALAYAFTMPPIFTAATRLLPPQQQSTAASLLASQFGGLAGIAGLAGLDLKNSAELYVALIKSRTIADRLVDRFNLIELYEVNYRQDARRALENATRVYSGKNGLITVEVDDKDPKRAASIANAYVEELFKLNRGLALTEVQQRRLFFERELRKAHDELKLAQTALAKTGVAESLVKSSPETIVAELARLRALVAAQETKLAAMRGYLTEQSPEYMQAQRELMALRTQLAGVDRKSPAQQTTQSEYLNRYRDFKYQETLLELMAKQYEIARLDEAREGNVIQVVDEAVPPEKKSRPRRALIAILATLASGLVLLVFVFVRQAFRNARRHPESASKIARLAVGLRRQLGL